MRILVKTHKLYVIVALTFLLAACQQSPAEKSAKYIATGIKLLQQHDAPRAILQFRNAVQATPRNAEAYFQLGMAYLQFQDTVRAAAYFRRALELNEKHAGARLRMAELLAGTDDPDALKFAAATLEAFLRDAPENSNAMHALGLTELKLGASREALDHLQRAFEISPEDWAIAATLAQAKLQQKDFQGAEAILKQACDKSPKSADARVMLGRFYLSQKDTARAEEQYRRALSVDSKSTAALINLAMLLADSGRTQEAERAFKQLEQSPLNEFQSLYGVYLFQEGKREDAIREFERKVKADPDDRLARARLLTAYQAMNRPADAQRVIENALKKNPKDLDALLARGEFALNVKKFGDAEADLTRVLHARPDSPEAHYGMAKVYLSRGAVLAYRQSLNEVLHLNPRLLAARIELAQSLIAGNSGKAALAVLDETPANQKMLLAVVEQRNWAFYSMQDFANMQRGVEPALKQQRSLDLLFQDALLKINSGKFSEARQELKEASAIAPDDVRALNILMRSYIAEKQVPAGVAAVRAYAQTRPKSPEVQFFLGNLLLKTGNKADAQQAFTTVRTLDPSYVPASLELARASLQQANWNDARQKLTEILSTEGDNPLARSWLGMAEESAGNHDAAITAFRKVLEVDPNNPLALNNLAFLLAEYKDQKDEALKYAQKAQEASPDAAYIQDTLGWVLYRKGVYPMAIKYLEMANSREGTALQKVHLAMAYAGNGDKTRGRTLLDAALRMDPKLPEAKTAQELFR